jgi:adenosine deaminase
MRKYDSRVWPAVVAAALSLWTAGGAAAQTGQQPADTSAEALTARYFDAIRGDPVRTVMFLRELPKGADLHSHLSGAVYAETYIAWAAESGLCVVIETSTFVVPPCDAAAGRPPAATALQSSALFNRIVDAMSIRNWTGAERSGHAQFFDAFDRFRAVSTRTGPMLAEVVARAAAGRVSYLELMVTVDAGASDRLGRTLGWDDDLDRQRERLLQAGLRDSAAAALLRLDAAEAAQREQLGCGTARADAGCAVEVRYLYQVVRARPAEQVFAQILMGLELAAMDPRVVGLNLVQPEDHQVVLRDHTLQMQLIAALRRHYPGVRISLHAGELAPGLVPPERLRSHIREAVEIAGAERIGHGASIAHEDGAHELLLEMARRGVLVEIALGSNDVILGLRGRHHPLRLYLAYGVPVALVTDDEAVLRSDITLEFQRAVEEHALRYPELKALARNSLVHAFVDDATKARLLQRLDADFAAFERTYAERLPWIGH